MYGIVTFIAGALGFCARLGWMIPGLQDAAVSRVEFSVPTNSWKRTAEGLFLHEAGVDPYSGDMFHETPLCLAFFSTLRKWSPSVLDLLFPMCDLLSAILLFLFARNVVERTVIDEHKVKSLYKKESLHLMISFDAVSTVPRMVLLWYLCNPLLIGSCLAKTTTVFTNVLLSAMLFFASNSGRCIIQRMISIVFLSFAAYQTLYMLLLFPPLHLYLQHVRSSSEVDQPRKSSYLANVFAVTLDLLVCFGVIVGLFFFSNYYMASWTFLRGVYGFLITAPDLTPNVGLYWYFFTEMFEQFRPFFTYVFLINICIYSIPLSTKLRHDPAFAIFVLLPLITVFKPYPSYGDVGFYLSLFPLWRHLISQMRQTLIVTVMMIVAGVLFPVLWKLWLQVGSANANFIYAITLVFATAQVFFVTDVILAHEKRRWHLTNGMESQNADGLKMDLVLQ